ncbi:MAG: serine hydrolase [Planctomycetaceae bacterium]|nr:serine hydrolase [Planctomycetaceae bacterium]
MQTSPLVVAAFLAATFVSISSSGNAVGQGAETAGGRAVTVPDLYFPSRQGPWQSVDAEAAGWNQGQLDALVDWAGDRGSTSVLILWQGRVLAEKHWGKGGGATSSRFRRMFVGLNDRQQAIEDVASVQKSIVSILVGVAVHKNLVQVEDFVSKHLTAGWSKATPTQEARIKVKHLLSMTSGLTDDLHFRAKPGTRWSYNTAAYAVVRDCLVASSGLSVHELTRKWLMDPIGMKESKWIPRSKSITALNAFGFASSARDLARVGLLMQAEGKWAGNKVLPDDRFRVASVKASQQLRPNYGYLWWLNEPVRLPAAPSDTYSANGALGRRIFVSPSEGLVVVRLGDEPKNVGAAGFDREFWRRLIAAKLEGRP